MDTIHPEISARCKGADLRLWEAYYRSKQPRLHDSDSSRLLFPRYRDEVLRVSEQEARFAFVESLHAGSLLYSVETPTSRRYKFSGATSLSAQTDVSLYDNDGLLICNVEFKAKGISPAASGQEHVRKDIEKLLREPVWGLWFHLLQRVDNSTIGSLLSVLARQIVNVQSEHTNDAGAAPGLTIHVCVLEPGFSIHKDMPTLPGSDRSMLLNELTISPLVSSGDALTEKCLNGWKWHRRNDLLAH